MLLSTHLITRPKKEPEHQGCENRFEVIETKLSGIKSDHRKITGEWVDYHSRLDTLIRRGIRLGVLERKNKQGEGDTEDDNSAPSPSPVVLSRSELLAGFRRKNAPTKSGT